MEVYVEYVILDNLIIDFIILSVTFSIIGSKVSRKNCLFSSLLGTLFTLFMPLISSVESVLFLYRLMVGIIIVLCAKKYSSFGQLICTYLLFVTLTFLFGGLLIATLSVFDIVYTTSGLIFLNFEIPLSLFILPIWLYSLCILKVVKFLKNRWKINKFMYDIILIENGKEYKLKAFLDTGNSLYDIDGRPCMVMELKTFVNIFPNFPIQKILIQNEKVEVLDNMHYIDVQTVNTRERLMVFDAETIIIKGKDKYSEFSNVCIAVSRKNFNEYNMILHRNFC